MKIIFLDIDGVLNSLTSAISNKRSYSPAGLSKDAIGLLKFVVEHTDAKIVISSTWRSFGSNEWFIGLFEAYGWHRPPIIDRTRPNKSKEIRGDQINDWLSDNNVENYICIDDDSDFYDYQNLVQTKMVNGFQLYDALKCIDILGNIKSDSSKLINDLKLHIGNYDERIHLDNNSNNINDNIDK